MMQAHTQYGIESKISETIKKKCIIFITENYQIIPIQLYTLLLYYQILNVIRESDKKLSLIKSVKCFNTVITNMQHLLAY